MKKSIRELLAFGVVGVINTVIGTSVMFLAYNFFKWGYWPSTALNYIVGSLFSYFANKRFTFKSDSKSVYEILRFVLNIVVCYIIAYSLAVPFVEKILACLKVEFAKNITEQLAMLCGMVIFVLINFLGQKIFVFQRG